MREYSPISANLLIFLFPKTNYQNVGKASGHPLIKESAHTCLCKPVIYHNPPTEQQLCKIAQVGGYDRYLFFNVVVDVVTPTVKVLTALIKAHIEIATPIFIFQW